MTAHQILPFVVQGSLALMLVAVALQCHWSDVTGLLRRPVFLLKAVVAVNLVVLAVALLLALNLPIDRPVAVALVLMAVSPLAPLVPSNALKAGAERGTVIGLYLLLILLAMLIVPFTVMALERHAGLPVEVPLAVVGRLILVWAVVPILVSLAIAAVAPEAAKRLAGIARILSNVALLLLFALILWVAGGKLLSFVGNGTLLVFAATVIAGLAAGHLLGGPNPSDRHALAVAAAVRHPGIAATIGHGMGASADAISATLLFLIVGAIAVAVYGRWASRRTAPAKRPA